MRWRYVAVALPLLGIGFAGCGKEAPPKPMPVAASSTTPQISPELLQDPRLTSKSPYQNVRPGVRYVGDAACAACHEQIAQSYRKHPMGTSLLPVAEATPIERYDAESHDPFRLQGGGQEDKPDQKAGVLCSITQLSGKTIHDVTRTDSHGATIAKMTAEVQFVLGSGSQGRSYLVNRDGYLFLSPLSWFTQPRRWDVSPGFTPDNLHLDRPITATCLFCHSNYVVPTAGAVNRFEKPLFRSHAIGCERCHGPGEKHVQTPGVRIQGAGFGEQESGSADYTIVNPRHLTPALREAVCEQCHLQGEMRVLHAGREIFDYRPGLPLHQFWSIFEPPAGKGGSQRAVGHVEQMYASRCFQKSDGRLGCISCHDPHKLPDPAEKIAYYRQRCLECHEKSDAACTAAMADRQATKPADNCMPCHMSRFASADIAHTSQTDHRVLRRPETRRPPAPPVDVAGGLQMVSFHRKQMTPAEEPLVARDLAVILIDNLPAGVLETESGTPGGMTFGRALELRLEPAVAALPDDLAGLEAKGAAVWLQGRTREAAEVFDAVLARAPDRESTLVRAGTLALIDKRFDAAIGYWQRAVKVNPWRLPYQLSLAQAFSRKEDWPAALAACQRALELNANSVDARVLLITCHFGNGDPKRAEAEFNTLMEFHPAQEETLRRWFERRSAQGK